MLCTITNLSASLTLNALDTYTAGSGPSGLIATGGARKLPLPYPFDWVVLAPSGTKQTALHPRDWRYKNVPSQSQDAGELWQYLVQNGTVSMTFAAETGRRDAEELFITAV